MITIIAGDFTRSWLSLLLKNTALAGQWVISRTPVAAKKVPPCT